MDHRRQVLSFFAAPKIISEFSPEQDKEVFRRNVVQTVFFPDQALLNFLYPERSSGLSLRAAVFI